MKTIRPLVALLAVFAAMLVPVQAQQPPGRLNLSFNDILALPKGRAVVFTTARIKSGGSVAIHCMTSAPIAARPNGGEQGVNVFYFGVKPDNSGILPQDQYVIPTTPTIAAGSAAAGTVTMVDYSFARVAPYLIASDNSARLIVAVVGYDVRAAGAPATPFPLPRELFLSAQLDIGGTALLLPAVQKVREAAAR